MTERDDQMKEYITWTRWGPRIVSGTVRCVDGLWFGVDKRGPREYVVTELTTGLAAHNASKPFTNTKAAWEYLTPEIVRRVRELISTGPHKEQARKVREAYEADTRCESVYWDIYGEGRLD